MRKWTVAVASGLVAVGTLMPAAMAATTGSKTPSGHVVVNNQSYTTPVALNRSGSKYVPLWYVMKSLKSVGLWSKWTGGDWLLSTSGKPAEPGSSQKRVRGQVTVYLNGSELTTIPAIVAKDPFSHRATTWVQVSGLSSVLQKAGLFAEWTGGSYELQTPVVKALDDAYQNTQNAPESQLTGNLTETLHFTMQNNSSSTNTPMPDITIQMNMTADTGTVNGVKAALVTITPQSSQSTGSTAPTTIQEYVQGSRVWLNQGQGWVEQTSSEQLLQSLQAEMPLSNVNFSVLRNIQSTTNGTATDYTATLDSAALTKALSPVLGSLANVSTGGQTALSSSQMASLLETIIKSTKGTMDIEVQPVNGQDLLTSEKLDLSMSLPLSTLAAQLGSSSTGGIQSVSIHETMSADYTYNNVTITPPTGINTSTPSSP